MSCSEFKMRGGTEVGFLSVSQDKSTAQRELRRANAEMRSERMEAEKRASMRPAERRNSAEELPEISAKAAPRTSATERPSSPSADLLPEEEEKEVHLALAVVPDAAKAATAAMGGVLKAQCALAPASRSDGRRQSTEGEVSRSIPKDARTDDVKA